MASGTKGKIWFRVLLLIALPAAFSDSHQAPTCRETPPPAEQTIAAVVPVWIMNDETPARAVISKFSGERDRKHVQLAWQTEREINNSGFEVQRASSQSRGWERLTFVPGVGTTSLGQSYMYTDRNAPPEDLRYMLRVLGSDGVIQYSQIITIPAGALLRSFTVEVPENSFSTIFTANIELDKDAQVALSLIDENGITMLRVLAAKQLTRGSHELPFDCAKLPGGEYRLLLHSPEGRFSRQIFIP
jgi:hypothetical protein